MNRMYRRVIFTLLLLAALIAVTGAVKVDAARAEWMSGFQKMETADKSAAGNAVGALDLYRESLEIFENVRRKYPQWNPTLLNYRINYCQQKIRELEQKMESQANTLSSDELLALTKRQAKQLQESENARKELNSRVSFLSESLQKAREEASKGAGYEVTVANLAASKANNEKELEKLRIEVKSLEEKLKQSTKRSAEAEKLAKELDKAQRNLAESAAGLSAMRRSFDEKKHECEKLERELKLSQRNMEDKETALKLASELAESRKQELAALHVNAASLEKRNSLLERGKSEQEAELASCRRQEQKLNEEIATLKQLRLADAAVIGELRSGADKALLTENESRRLKAELDAAQAKLKSSSENTVALEAELTELRDKYKQSRALALNKDEKNLELTSKMAAMKTRQEKAEQQALRLTAELEEARILLGKSRSDTAEQQRKLQTAEGIQQEKEILEKKLQVQTELAIKQEKQLAEQLASIQKLEKQLAERGVSLQKAEASLAESRESESLLQRQLKAEKGSVEERERALAELRKENRELVNKNEQLLQRKSELERLNAESVDASRLVASEEANKKIQLEVADLKDKLQMKERELKSEGENMQKLVALLQSEKDKNSQLQQEMAENVKNLTEKLAAANNEIAVQQKRAQEQQQVLIKERTAAEVKYAELEKRLTDGDVSLKKQLQSLMKMQADNTEKSRQIVALEQRGAQNDAEMKRLNDALNKMHEEKKLLNAKLQVVDGLTATVAELEEQIKSEQEKVRKIKAEGEAAQHSADIKFVSYETRLKEKDQIISDLRTNAADTPAWLARLKEMEKKYDEEQKRKMALEAVLVEMEAKLKRLQNEAAVQTAAARKAHDEQAEAIRRAEDAARAEAESRAAQKAALEEANRKVQEAKAAQEAANSQIDEIKQMARQAQEKQVAAENKAAEAVRRAEEANKHLSELEVKVRQESAEATKNEARLQVALDDANKRLKQAEKMLNETKESALPIEKKLQKIRDSQKNYSDIKNEIAALRSAKEAANKESIAAKESVDKQLGMVMLEAESRRAAAARQAVVAAQVAAEAKAAMARQTDAESQVAEANKWMEDATINAKKAAIQYENAQKQQTGSLDTDELRFTREKEKKAIVKGFLRQGIEAERQGKAEAARHNYQQVLSFDADNKLALQRLGLLAAADGNDMEASRYLGQAFRFDPDDIDTLLALGFSQARLGRSDWAISYLGRAVALQPENGNAVRLYGSALFSLGWSQAAEKLLKQAVALNEKDAEAQYNLAVLMATAQPPRLTEGLEWYRKAIGNGAQPDPGLDKVFKRK